ncbi:MAG TPA: ABC transporter substrate-binding protein, partial [Dehalococcoidia bacterium]|nr:ABC transporter substrate-binding protein [Dehalococcoidia bacterium]
TLDPQTLSQAPTNTLAGAVMSRPFRYKTGADPSTITNHDVEPDLAASAESPDAITWTIKLRPGATFHNVSPVNGHAVEAEDVKATYLRALKLPNNPNRGALGMIDPDQIQTPDKSTVVFKLNYPYAPFRGILASPAYSWIFPREALAGSYEPAKTMIGSGPFLVDSVTPDVEFSVKKNTSWFESGRPYVTGIRFAVIPTQAQQEAQITSGHLDDAQIGQNDLDMMTRSNPNAALIKIPPSTGANIYTQQGDPTSVFMDVRVRRALSMAFDRESLAKAVFNNQYVNSLFVPTFLGKWSLKMEQLDARVSGYYKYDPTEAKMMLRNAGVTNQSFKFAFTISSNSSADPGRNNTAETLNSMINAIGFKTTPTPIDFAKDYIDSGKGYRQGFYPKDTIVYGNSQAFTEVDDFVFGYFHSKSTQNQVRVSDPSLDAMIDKARTIVDEDARLKAYLDIQKYVADKAYIIPVGWGLGFWMVQPRVQNYQQGSTAGVAVETYAKVWLKA